ncbi:helix-turn-helix domain containing protein [Stigmatella sp. ncwal1]|uniref:Helix-turn-helix domain containing protein n=1 Tax=Stigmatella ashevillensis TaxID=2995309 RepID=A0ABT5D1W4_9BACT|nr:TetR/AcrR family transcriptional regulator [Stigmatella ashevillena]MDC0707128.1 helix-turn-helix domain containing protein [Stigmatella ashevillena]
MKKPTRADAQRNLDLLLEAAKAVFAESGVDAPVREIASRAGVGIATVYRHFPERAELIAAVYRREIDACAAAASALAREHEPFEALARWLHRFVSLIATKRGLAASLNAQDPAYQALPAYFRQHLEPVLKSLLNAAAAAGEVRDDIDPYELLRGVGNLSVPVAEVAPGYSRRMVDLLIDGLRYGTSEARTPAHSPASRQGPRRR